MKKKKLNIYNWKHTDPINGITKVVSTLLIPESAVAWRYSASPTNASSKIGVSLVTNLVSGQRSTCTGSSDAFLCLGLVNASNRLQCTGIIIRQRNQKKKNSRMTHRSCGVHEGERIALQTSPTRSENELAVNALRELVVHTSILTGCAWRIWGESRELGAVPCIGPSGCVICKVKHMGGECLLQSLRVLAVLEGEWFGTSWGTWKRCSGRWRRGGGSGGSLGGVHKTTSRSEAGTIIDVNNDICALGWAGTCCPCSSDTCILVRLSWASDTLRRADAMRYRRQVSCWLTHCSHRVDQWQRYTTSSRWDNQHHNLHIIIKERTLSRQHSWSQQIYRLGTVIRIMAEHALQ